MYDTLITPAQLQTLIDQQAPLMVFDCSFDLMKPEAGVAAYQASHIPGAVHADLDQALSAKHGPAASGGRHPLPTRERFAEWLRSVGFRNDMQAVVYDRQGANFCGRLWWMLQWAGHGAVAVLDGGLPAWQAAGLPVTDRSENPLPASHFVLHAPLLTLVGTEQVHAGLGQPTQTVIDARAGARYRGEVEPLDPIAGHIPGALNRPFTDNIGADGRFKAPEQLRAEFEAVLNGRDARTVVHQCGSGVSAVPNLLAMRIAGLGNTALYAGSWSEWSNTAGLPVHTGAQP